jgi:hypothetical protein
MRWLPALATVAPLAIALSVALAACSSSDSVDVAPDGGSDEDAGDATLRAACPASGVSKGPWTIAMTRTGIKIRWEACRAGTTPEVAFSPEEGGAETTATSVETKIDLSEEHTAPLNALRCPADSPGTYFTHEAALAGLTPGTCYRYQLRADRALGGRFCTSRPDGATVRWLSIGDTNPLLGPATGKVIAALLPAKPDFVLHGGDIEYYDSGFETWAGWFPVMQPLLAVGSLQPALGNHEHETDDELEDYSLRFFGDAAYGGASMHYRFETGGLYFHALNTEDDFTPESPQGQWLAASLTEAAAQPGFRGSIVFMHRPFATCGDNAEADSARKGYASLFAQQKVVLVMQAHIHIYERFEIDGLTYVTSGGGGGLIGKDDANISRAECASRKSAGAFFHAIDMVADGNELRGTVIDDSAAVRDTFTIPLP